MNKSVYQQFYELERDHWWFKGMRNMCLRMITQYVPNKSEHRILDVGCGTGELTRALVSFGVVTGADSSDEALIFCRRRGLNKLVKTSAECTPFGDNTFSLIIAFGLIEHLNNDQLFLKEMYRVLQPGGSLIILTSAFNFLWSEHDVVVHHKRRYRISELKIKFNSAGYKIRKISYVNFMLFHFAVIRRILSLFKVFNNRAYLGTPYVFRLNRLVNSFLYKVLNFETMLLTKINFTYGIGILCVVQKGSLES